jgi:gliding motility-associated-like protein
LPDLDVPALSPDAAIEDVLTGAQRSFEADVRNRFFDVSTSFVTRFELTRPDGTTQAAGTTTLSTLAADQQQTVQSDAVTFNAPGEYTLCAIADADAQVEESDEANNTNCLTIPVRTPQPDLVAEELVLAESEEGTLDDVLISQTRTFECRFANRGDEGASIFTAAIFLGDEEVASNTFGPLGVGSSATLSATVPFPETGTAQVRCVVDTGEEIAELSEDNNEVTQSVTVDTREELTVRPNPFTPNEDGFNDRVQFEVTEFGLNQPTLKVFSFEGRLIRTVDTVVGGNLEWDGRDNGDQAQPPGVYLYLVEEGGQTAASGHVTLAR